MRASVEKIVNRASKLIFFYEVTNGVVSKIDDKELENEKKVRALNRQLHVPLPQLWTSSPRSSQSKCQKKSKETDSSVKQSTIERADSNAQEPVGKAEDTNEHVNEKKQDETEAESEDEAEKAEKAEEGRIDSVEPSVAGSITDVNDAIVMEEKYEEEVDAKVEEEELVEDQMKKEVATTEAATVIQDQNRLADISDKINQPHLTRGLTGASSTDLDIVSFTSTEVESSQIHSPKLTNERPMECSSGGTVREFWYEVEVRTGQQYSNQSTAEATTPFKVKLEVKDEEGWNSGSLTLDEDHSATGKVQFRPGGIDQFVLELGRPLRSLHSITVTLLSDDPDVAWFLESVLIRRKSGIGCGSHDDSSRQEFLFPCRRLIGQRSSDGLTTVTLSYTAPITLRDDGCAYSPVVMTTPPQARVTSSGQKATPVLFGKSVAEAIATQDLDRLKELANFSTVLLTWEDAAGLRPVHLAAQVGSKAAPGHAEMVWQLLVERGADPNCRSAEIAGLQTPLHVAVTHGSVPLVKTILATPSVDPLLCDSNGNSALHLAITRCHYDVADYLISQKFKFPATNDAGQTAADLVDNPTQDLHIYPHLWTLVEPRISEVDDATNHLQQESSVKHSDKSSSRSSGTSDSSSSSEESDSKLDNEEASKRNDLTTVNDYQKHSRERKENERKEKQENVETNEAIPVKGASDSKSIEDESISQQRELQRTEIDKDCEENENVSEAGSSSSETSSNVDGEDESQDESERAVDQFIEGSNSKETQMYSVLASYNDKEDEFNHTIMHEKELPSTYEMRRDSKADKDEHLTETSGHAGEEFPSTAAVGRETSEDSGKKSKVRFKSENLEPGIVSHPDTNHSLNGNAAEVKDGDMSSVRSSSSNASSEDTTKKENNGVGNSEDDNKMKISQEKISNKVEIVQLKEEFQEPIATGTSTKQEKDLPILRTDDEDSSEESSSENLPTSSLSSVVSVESLSRSGNKSTLNGGSQPHKSEDNTNISLTGPSTSAAASAPPMPRTILHENPALELHSTPV